MFYGRRCRNTESAVTWDVYRVTTPKVKTMLSVNTLQKTLPGAYSTKEMFSKLAFNSARNSFLPSIFSE